jgi:hypothetical protein
MATLSINLTDFEGPTRLFPSGAYGVLQAYRGLSDLPFWCVTVRLSF